MTTRASGARASASDHEPLLAQACYSWASRLPDGSGGYGFVAFSPSLQDNQAWFEQLTKDVCSYAGNARMTDQERAAYRPLGRLVAAGMSIAYRKLDAGRDAHGRTGRYLVHFLVAPISLLRLSEVLAIPDMLWLSEAQVPLDQPLELRDLALAQLRGPADLALPVVDREGAIAIARAARCLAQTGALDVSTWEPALLAVLLACLPGWVNQEATLEAEWKAGRARSTLRIAGQATIEWSALEPPDGLPGELAALNERIGHYCSLAEIARALGEPDGSPSPVLRGQPLDDAVRAWIDGESALGKARETLLLEDPPATLGLLAERGMRLPSGRRADRLAVRLLRGLSEPSAADLVAAVLPLEQEALGAYVASAPTLVVLLGALACNAEAGQITRIDFTRQPEPGTLAALVRAAADDGELLEQLAETLRESSLREGSFAKALISDPHVDPDLLYAEIVPRAAKDHAELLGLISLNPAPFIAWARCPAPYADALAAVLARESRHAVWQRVSALLGRWGKR